MANFYVYVWKNPLKDNIPFYIGKGKGNRAYKHLNQTINETFENAKNKRKYSTVKSILNAGSKPIVEIIKFGLEENDAFSLETELINYYGRRLIDSDGILDNVINEPLSPPGGKKGMKHRSKRSKKAVENQVTSRRINGNYIVKDSTRELWKKQRTGRKASNETKLLMSEQRSGSKNHNSIIWTITSPNGVEYIVNCGLKKWCKENNLSFNNIYFQKNGWIVSKNKDGKGGKPRKGIINV